MKGGEEGEEGEVYGGNKVDLRRCSEAGLGGGGDAEEERRTRKGGGEE